MRNVEIRKVRMETVNVATNRVNHAVIWVVEIDGEEVGCGMTKREAKNIAQDYEGARK